MQVIKRSEVSCYRMSLGYVLGEVGEVLEEVVKLDWNGFVSELVDVYSCGIVWFWDWVGIDGWVIKSSSMREWDKRWEWWKKWLQDNGLYFRREFMRVGANYKRKRKRELVFGFAYGSEVHIDGGYVFNMKGGIVGTDTDVD